MVPVNDNTKSSEGSVVEQQVPIDVKKNSNWISNIHKERMARKITGDRTTIDMAIQIVYVFLF